MVLLQHHSSLSQVHLPPTGTFIIQSPPHTTSTFTKFQFARLQVKLHPHSPSLITYGGHPCSMLLGHPIHVSFLVLDVRSWDVYGFSFVHVQNFHDIDCLSIVGDIQEFPTLQQLLAICPHITRVRFSLVWSPFQYTTLHLYVRSQIHKSYAGVQREEQGHI